MGDVDDDRKRLAVGLLAAHGIEGADPGLAQLRHLPGGWSRHSYALGVPTAAGGREELIIRVKPPGSLLDTDIGREYETYVMLQPHGVPVPRVYGYHAEEDNPFGGPFFVMERLPGEAPNVWQRRDRQRLEENWKGSRSLGNDLVEILARIHTVEDPRGPEVAGRQTYRELVAQWEQTWAEVRFGPDPVLDSVFDWLRAREPASAPEGLVHGDYRIGNTLITGDRIRGVLDWELCHWGDTRFDLGYVLLAYLAGKFFAPVTDLVSAVADPEWFLARYEELVGQEVDRQVVRTFSALGAVVLVVILATGVRQYRTGRTSDIRMAWNRFAIPGLRQDLATLMEW